MRLTSFTDYAVRVLIYAAKKGGELSSIKEVSESYQISSNHLMKVVHVLGKGGYLHTVRGKNGGFCLGKEPSEISIGDLIRYTEDDLNIVECLSHKKGRCALIENCKFANIMKEALGAFLSVADSYTLEDIVKNGNPLNFDN